MKRLLFMLLLAYAVNAVYSQQVPLLTQFMFNKLAFNPACAGSREVLTIDATYRNQWTGVEGAPKTMNFSIHAPMRDPHIGLGMYLYNYNIGAAVDQGAMATFAYRIQFPNGKLSFGLQAGLKYYDVDWTKIITLDPGDPKLTGQIKQKMQPDANFGIYYYSDQFYVGISSKQLLQNQVTLVQNGNSEIFNKLVRHFYGMTGINLPINDQILFCPSLLFKYVGNAPSQIDVNASFMFGDTFLVGASYRTEKTISILTEIKLTSNLRLGYAYDIWFNEIQNYSKGSHEIRLSLDFGLLKNRVRAPEVMKRNIGD